MALSFGGLVIVCVCVLLCGRDTFWGSYTTVPFSLSASLYFSLFLGESYLDLASGVIFDKIEYIED